MNKKTLVLTLLIQLLSFNEVYQKLSEKSFKTFTQTNKISIVLIYEPWCKYSQIALEIFKKLLHKNQFLDLKIPVGFLDTHEIVDFKEYKGIKNIPKIFLYKD